jgi:hypothetical protein
MERVKRRNERVKRRNERVKRRNERVKRRNERVKRRNQMPRFDKNEQIAVCKRPIFERTFFPQDG